MNEKIAVGFDAYNYALTGEIMNTLRDGSGGGDCKPMALVIKPCFQETGFGWWNESQIAQTIRTNVGGGGMLANIVIEEDENIQSDQPKRSLPGR